MSRLSDAIVPSVAFAPVTFQANDRIIINGIEQLKGVCWIVFASVFRHIDVLPSHVSRDSAVYLPVMFVNSCLIVLQTVRYVGGSHFKPGQWVGIELDVAVGKNDGSVEGVRYFQCTQNKGVFVRPEVVQVSVLHPPMWRAISSPFHFCGDFFLCVTPCSCCHEVAWIRNVTMLTFLSDPLARPFSQWFGAAFSPPVLHASPYFCVDSLRVLQAVASVR